MKVSDFDQHDQAIASGVKEGQDFMSSIKSLVWIIIF